MKKNIISLKIINIKPRITSKFILVFAGFILLFFCGAKAASAASLYFSPSSGSYEVEKTFNVSVYVSSVDQAMNAASGVISFPKDKLEATSLSKDGSIFSLWVQEPAFSNSAGVVNFEGIVLNPGFSGSGGKIMTINFKAKSVGQAGLNFSSGSILANDGAGTNILNDTGSANYQLSAATVSPKTSKKQKTEEKTTSARVPAAPQISSSTHSDSSKWYNNKNPQFSWILPAGIDGVSINFSQSLTANPGSVPDSLFTTKSYENIEDGVWYFHIKMRNSSGWGPITHFKIQIDTAPVTPFEIKFTSDKKTENPQPTILLDATDSLSGVDYYKIKIGEGDFFSVASEIMKSNPYTLPLQNPGKRSILVQAFDKAGNYTTAVEEFEILPIKSPILTEYPKELQSEDPLIARGSTYPNSKVIIWLQREKDDSKSFTVESDQDGKFIFATDEKLNDGVYKLWTEVIDTRGAKSLPSEKVIIIVAKPAIFRVGTWAIGFLAIVIPLLALIILLLFIVWYGWYKFFMFRKKLKKEVREVELALHKSFDLLKEDIREQVKLLEKVRTKRELTKEEEKIIKQLGKHLDDAEKFVKKEIEDIEKEVK